MALVIALGGTSYALTLPSNSVGAKQLRRGAVTGVKLGPGAVTSDKVKNRSLLAADFKAGQLPTGATGQPGPKGSPGVQGPKGDPGDDAEGLVRAYALVDTSQASPTLSQPRTRHFADVSSPATGVYCLTPSTDVAPINQVHPSTAAVVAGVVGSKSTTVGVPTYYSDPTDIGCSASQIAIQTVSALGQPTAGVSFTVVVPSTPPPIP